MRVAVIGGGPAGLVTLKYLLQASGCFSIEPIEVCLFEKEDSVGGTFQFRVYEDAELVSSRFLTQFSDFRLPDDSPDYTSAADYCKYLRDYATRFKLWQHIKLETTVHRVRRGTKGGHVVTFSKNGSSTQEQWYCDAVAVCSGLNVTPNLPKIKGLEHVPKTLHSSDFKSRKQFGENTNVMILGAGETAMDVAYLAVTSRTKSVTLCHRGGWKHAPKRLSDPIYNGNVKKWAEDLERNGPSPPTDTAFASLFDTAYVPPALQRSPWLWAYYDKYTRFYNWLLTGTPFGPNQYAGELRGNRHHARKMVPMKSNKAQAYISAPYRPQVKSMVETIKSSMIRVPQQDLQGRQIDLAPWPDHIDADGVVHFRDNGRPEYQKIKNVVCKPDVLVYATGYTQVFPFFDESYPTIFDADVRRVWKTGVDHVGFMGFVRPAFGAIPALAELQAQLWITNLLNRLPRPIQVNEDYLLLPDTERRLDYIVDHDTYAYCLACDTGTAPSIFEVLSFGRTVFLTWALGPNFNTKFRLVGPWKWDGAAEIMETELWGVISRRKGFLVWTSMTFLPILLFGPLSFLYYIAYGILDMFRSIVHFARPNAEDDFTLDRGSLVETPLRGTDRSGEKKAQAIRDACGSETVLTG